MSADRKPVSVVIPTRNGRDTLERALQSLLPNAGYIHEVLLVFSNSDANYREWCGRLLARYGRFFHASSLDSGAASNSAVARNCGIQAAAGPDPAFLDDDDEWMPHKLDEYLRTVAQRRLSGDFVLFSTVVSCLEDRSDWLLSSRSFPTTTRP